jgi:DNA-binding FadR family transcriptional regulator
MAMLKKATQSTLLDNIVNQIENSIADGTFKPGEKLPAPRQLQDFLGVSRGTLREALKVLEQKGLIELKPGVGGGAFIKTISADQISQSLAFLIRHQKISLEHITEFREGLESIVAGLAAKRAKKPEVDKLRELVDETKKCLEKGESHWDEFLQIDVKFHLVLAQMSRNPLHIPILEAIHRNIHQYYMKYLPISEDVVRDNYKDLKNILKAVETRDQTRACDLAYRHPRRFYKHMEPSIKA